MIHERDQRQDQRQSTLLWSIFFALLILRRFIAFGLADPLTELGAFTSLRFIFRIILRFALPRAAGFAASPLSADPVEMRSRFFSTVFFSFFAGESLRTPAAALGVVLTLALLCMRVR